MWILVVMWLLAVYEYVRGLLCGWRYSGIGVSICLSTGLIIWLSAGLSISSSTGLGVWLIIWLCSRVLVRYY
jgi:hypothetical protein